MRTNRGLVTDFWYPAFGAVLVSTSLLLSGCSASTVSSSQSTAPEAPSAELQVDSEPVPALPEVVNDVESPALAVSPLDADPASGSRLTALDAAQQLTVKGRAPKTGYARSQFGQAWADVDRNGCDTRNDILGRDLTEIVFKEGTRDCRVLTGILTDPYSGSVINFTQGADTSSAVQIDHVVALSDAWQKGAQNWSEATRVIFANDPLNLLAVDGPLNQQKGDEDTATWLPPNKAYRCAYVARQVAVKHLYGLWVTAAEQEAMFRVLSSCPNEPLPDGGYVVADTLTPIAGVAAPSSASTDPGFAPPPANSTNSAPPATDPIPDSTSNAPAADQNVYFKNCTEAWAAGAAPIKIGEPGYGTHLDRDGDGIGCESKPR